MFLLISSASIWISGCQTEELIKKLKHDNPAVRVNAIWKLGKIGFRGKGAVPVLTQSLQNGNNWVFLDSAETLKKIAHPIYYNYFRIKISLFEVIRQEHWAS